MSTVLVAEDVHKSYRRAGQADTVVLHGATLSVEAGDVVALIGPSGAGKSTLLHILASLDNADSGTVHLTAGGSSYEYSTMAPTALASVRSRHIGMVFQFHHLLPEFTAIENVMMPALISGVSSREARKLAMALVERVGMQHRTDNMPTELSGGEQQRIAIARALINNPTILFADEPTGNLDSANASLVLELLFELRASTGVTCVIATHSADLAAKAHRIVSMKDGRITS